MSIDLVERLRLAPDADFYRPSKWFELMNEAAEEIERLTAALQWIAARGDVDDLDSLDEIIERARAALEGK